MRLQMGAMLILAGALAACSSTKGVFEPRSTPPSPRPVQATGQARASESHYENGLRLYAKDKLRQAAKMFEQSLRHDPSNYRAAYYLAMCHNRRGRYEEARSYFRLALELGPDRTTALEIRTGLGYGYEMQRKFSQATLEYDLALKLDPENEYARKAKGRVRGEGNAKARGKKP